MRISDWSSDVCSSDLDVTRIEVGVMRPENLRDGAAFHDGAKFDRRGIRLRRAHAPAHIGIERQVEDLQQDFAFRGLRDNRLFDAEVLRCRGAALPRSQYYPTIDFSGLCHAV